VSEVRETLSFESTSDIDHLVVGVETALAWL
jgi:hypothetical protein